MLQGKTSSVFALSLLLTLAAPTGLPAAFSSRLALAQSAPTSFPLPNSVPSGTTVRVDGSHSMAAINQALKQKFEAQYGGTTVNLATEGTAAALRALLDGTIDLAAIGRPLTQAEKAQGLVEVPIDREKIAIIVGPNNPFRGSITFAQFARLFRGEITNWSQLGSTPGRIRFIDRPESSDTRQAFRNYKVFRDAPFRTGSTATSVSQDSTGAVIAALGRDGISYAVASQVVNQPNVRIVSMHGTLPTDPRYPFSQPRAYVYRGTPNAAVQSFLGFATAPVGQAAIAQARFTAAQAVATPGQSAATGSTASSTAGANSDAGAAASGVGSTGTTASPAASPAAIAPGVTSPSPANPASPATAASDTATPGTTSPGTTSPGTVTSETAGTPTAAGTTGTDPATDPATADREDASWLPWLLLPLVLLGGLLLWRSRRRPTTENVPPPTARPADPPASSGSEAGTGTSGTTLAQRTGSVISADRLEIMSDSPGRTAARSVNTPPETPITPGTSDLSPLPEQAAIPDPAPSGEPDIPSAIAPAVEPSVPPITEPEVTPAASDTVEIDPEMVEEIPSAAIDPAIPSAAIDPTLLGGAAVAAGTGALFGLSELRDRSEEDRVTETTAAGTADLDETEQPVAELPRSAEPDSEGAIEPKTPGINNVVEPVLPIVSEDAEAAIVPPQPLTSEAIQEAPAESLGQPGFVEFEPTEAVPPPQGMAAELVAFPSAEVVEQAPEEIAVEEEIAAELLAERDIPAIEAGDAAESSELAIESIESPEFEEVEPIPSETTSSDAAPLPLGEIAALGAIAAGMAAPQIDQPLDEQSIVEAARFDVGQSDLSMEELAMVDANLPDLPGGYGDSQIVLLPRDPQWAYAYWDVPAEQKQLARQQGGSRFALRFYDVTNVDFSRQNPHSLQQYECDEMARNWYIPVPLSDRDYIAEIGYVTEDGRWIMLARSLPVRIPPVYPSDWHSEQFLTVDWQADLRDRTFIELSPPGERKTFDNPIYDRIFGLTESAEAQRVAGSLYGSMQQVPEQAISSFASGAGLAARTESGIGMSGVGMAGITMSGVGMSGVGISGVGMSGIGMAGMAMSGAGIYSMSGIGMSGVGISGVGMSGIGMSSLSASGIGMMSGVGAIGMSGVGMSGVGMSGVGLYPGLYTMSGAGYTTSGIGMSGIGMSGIGMSGIGMMSGIGFSASMPPIRPRRFWLIADAELIVYGATEPDATVTIGGRPVQLNPDGTFRFQMSFQDGMIDFPILAVAADGEQTRSIHLSFERNTHSRHTNTREEAQDEWFPG